MKRISILLLLLINFSAHALEWEFRSSQTLAGLRNEQWKILPKELYPFEREFDGYIEYKANFEKNNIGTQQAVYLGKIGDADITYLNGQEIGRTGSFPPAFAYNMDTERMYYLPEAGLRNGHNEIKILVYTKYLVNKGFSPINFRLEDSSILDHQKYKDELRNNFSRLIIPILCLVLALVSFPIFAPKHLWNNQLMIFLIGITSFVLGVCRGRIGFHFFEIMVVYRVTIISSILTILLVTVHMTKKCKSIARFIPAFICSILITAMLLTKTLPEASEIGKIWFHVAPFIMLLAFYGTLKDSGMNSLKTIGFSVLFFTNLNDTLHDLRIINTGVFMQTGLGTFIVFMILDQLHLLKKSWEKYFMKESQLEIDAQLGRQAIQIAHDLRSPLETISEVANQIPLHSSEHSNTLRIGIHRLVEITESLLENKVPRLSLNNSNDIINATKEIVNEIQAKYKSNPRLKFPINSTGSDEKSTYRFDIVKYKRTVCNLIMNAVEATDGNGVVNIILEFNDGQFIFSVSDNGPGIKINSDLIFQRGFTTKPQGNGLGLSSAKCFVDSLNGKIEIHPLQKGTKISLSIPSTNQSNTSSSLNKLIVLIDDDALVRLNWKRQGEKNHFSVHTYDNFSSFVKNRQKYNSSTPIYIDSLLGEQKGEELSETLRTFGFKTIYLTTSLPESKIGATKWIDQIVGKSFESAVLSRFQIT